jgi:predicted nuclease with TOPRIM domain
MNIEELQAENSRLKAEVERLDAMANENAHLHKGIYSLSLNVVQLKDENERLRKAGDNLERVLISRSGSYEAGNASHEWQSAKNYKPSV